jgi:hypothetical protein
MQINSSNIDSSSKIQVITNSNKALQNMIQSAPQSTKESLPNLQDAILDIFSSLKGGAKKPLLNELLQNSTIFKTQGNFSTNLASLIESMKSDSTLDETTALLNKFLLNIKNLDATKLKDFILNSGLFLESKLLKKDSGKNIKGDLKAILLSLSSQTTSKGIHENIEKLLTQIDYFWLLSATNDSNYLYLPLDWDELEDASLNINKVDKHYMANIDLSLSNLGELNFKVMLMGEKDISISISAQKDSSLELIRENISLLKVALKSIGINTSGVWFVQDSDSPYSISNPYHDRTYSVEA